MSFADFTLILLHITKLYITSMSEFNPKQLSQKQKQDAWQLIQKTLQRECRKFLDETWRYIGMPMDDGADAVHQRYLGLYNRVRNFDRLIGHYYEDISSSTFYDVMTKLYKDGILTDDDLKKIDCDLRENIQQHD